MPSAIRHVFEGPRGSAEVVHVPTAADPKATRWEVQFHKVSYPCSTAEEAAFLATYLTQVFVEDTSRSGGPAR